MIAGYYFIKKLADTPLEASRGILIGGGVSIFIHFSFCFKKVNYGGVGLTRTYREATIV